MALENSGIFLWICYEQLKMCSSFPRGWFKKGFFWLLAFSLPLFLSYALISPEELELVFREASDRGGRKKQNKKTTTEPKKSIRMYLLEIVYRVQYMYGYVMSGRRWKEMINIRPSMSKAQKVTQERIHSCGTEDWEDEDCYSIWKTHLLVLPFLHYSC